MQDLVEETRSLKAKLDSLLQQQAGAEERDVWLIYARLEKTIALLKIRLDYESPGRSVELISPEGDLGALLVGASKKLAEVEPLLSAMKPLDALPVMREARDLLRSYLTEKKKAEIRTRRTTSKATSLPSPAPSSSSKP